MDTLLSWQHLTRSALSTEKQAAHIGSKLRGGEILELVSDLGGGKTTFVRGLARGAGSTDTVSSPTFKIRNEYSAAHCSIYHFDFYRLSEAGLIANELAELVDDPEAVCVIEWANVVHDVLPANRCTISLENKGENKRLIRASYPKALRYLFEDDAI